MSGVSGHFGQGNNSSYFGAHADGNLPMTPQNNRLSRNGQHTSVLPFPSTVLPEMYPGTVYMNQMPWVPSSFPDSSPFSHVSDAAEATGFSEYNLWQSIPSASRCRKNSIGEHLHPRSGRDQTLPAYEQQIPQTQYHHTTLPVGREPPNTSETGSWSQRHNLVGEWHDAQMQIPQPSLTHLNPRAHLEIQGIHNRFQGPNLLSPETGQRLGHPPTTNNSLLPELQHAPASLPSGLSQEGQYEPTSIQNAPFEAQWQSLMPPPPPSHWQTRPAMPLSHNPYGLEQNMFDYSFGSCGMVPTFVPQPILYSMPYPQPMYATTMNAAAAVASHPLVKDVQQELVDDTEDTSDSSTVNKKEVAPQPKTIKIRGIKDAKMALWCKYYFQNPDNGGGETQEVKWDNTENVYYITFTDSKVARRVSSSVHKRNNEQLEISFAPRGIPESVGLRTVEIIGGDVEFLDIYRLYFDNPSNGGGAISRIWPEKQTQKFYITFEDAAVAETVCKQTHVIEEYVLEAKLANIDHAMESTCDIAHVHEEWTTVKMTVGVHLKDERFYRQYFAAQSYCTSVEDFILNTKEGQLLVTFDSAKVAQQVANGRHEIDGREVEINLMKVSPFYQDKLLFRDVSQNAAKESVIHYMENISGQEEIELVYSDVPGDVVVTFHNKFGKFFKNKRKMSDKALRGRELKVHRVPVSNCILVQNLSSVTSDDEVAHYFESTRARGGTVIKIGRTEDQTVYVYFEDPQVAQRVAMIKHFLGGKELRVRIHLECLGPFGGREDPFLFVLPEPFNIPIRNNIKIRFLQHCTGIMQGFNECLSKVHAGANIVGDALKVECTLTYSVPEVHLLVSKWRDEANKQVEACFDTVRVDRQDVLPQIWPDVIKTVEKIQNDGDDLLLSLEDEHAFVIWGRKNTEGDTLQKIRSIVEDAEKEFALKLQEVSDTKDLEQHQLDLLIMSSFDSDRVNQHDRLNVHIHEKERKITFCGQLLDIREAQLRMLNIFFSASSKVLKDMTDSKITMLATKNARDTIRKKLTSSGLSATWDCRDNDTVTVFCVNEADLPQAIQIIQTSLIEETITLDDISTTIMTLPCWTSLKNDLLQIHEGLLTINKHANAVVITAISDIMPGVKEAVEKVITENSVYSAAFTFSPSRQRFLVTFWEERLTDIAGKQTIYKVDIRLDGDKKTIIVKGMNQGIELVRRDLETLERQIVWTEEIITRKETIAYLVGMKGLNELDVIARANQCVLSLSPEETGIQTAFTNQPVKQEKEKISDHTMVSAMKADITELSVDAIVNAANERLAHGGGVAGAIVSKGGKEIQEECYRRLQAIGSMSQGDVLVSGPGKLPCKFIIHAVGPRYKGGNQGEKECLQVTVLKCLKAATDIGCYSIALPAISSGIFGYPVEKATRDIVEAVRSFFRTNRESSIRDVRLCDVKMKTVELFQKALEQTSPGRKSTTISHDSQLFAEKESMACKEGFRRPPKAFTGIKFSVVEGEIAKMNTDVIVNSTSKNLNLRGGAISSSILTAAGPGLQDECRSKYPTGIPDGGIACTQNFKLACKAIFHVALCQWGDGAEQKLQSVVEKCLIEANNRHFSSMAIPALGTGVLRFPRDVAARTILTTIQRFQQRSPTASLKEIKVVVFQDPETLEAFSMVDSSQINPYETETKTDTDADKTVHESFPSFQSFKTDKEMEVSKNEYVGIDVSGATAGFYESEIYSDFTVDLGGLHVTIKQGDITEEDVDAIVNSTNSKMDFSKGAVSKVLMAKCGEVLTKECQTKREHMAQHKTVVTSAYNLKCKNILHVDAMFYRESGNWENAFSVVLQEAEKAGFQSLSVPALGTGNFQLTASDSAQALAKALDVHKQTMKTLRRVTVVVIDSGTMQAFSHVFKGEKTNEISSIPFKNVAKKSIFQWAKEKFGSIFKTRRDPVPDSFKFYIFAASPEKREEFLRVLHEFVDGKYEEREMKDFEKLSPEELEEITEVCKSLNVEVQKKPTGACVLKGMPNDIERIRCLIRETDQQRQEIVMSNLVQWYYFQGKYIGDNPEAFGQKENLLIEKAYQNFRTKTAMKDSVEFTDDKGLLVTINFTDMKKYSGQSASDGIKVMRKEKIEGGVRSASLLPVTWEIHEEEAVKLVDLPRGCEEYMTVHDNFAKTAQTTFSVETIQRIQNPELYKQYCAKKVQIDKQNKGIDLERTLWHGTSSDSIQSINLYGFNRSFCGKNAIQFGQGAYFAVNSAYSMQNKYAQTDPMGRKYVYQCKVLVGYSVKGYPAMKIPPVREGEIRYDSATNDVDNPGMYVIFHDSQAYPEYLITFT